MRKLAMVTMVGMVLISFASAGLVDFLSNPVQASYLIKGPVFYLTDFFENQYGEDYVLQLNEQPSDGEIIVVHEQEASFVSEILGVDEFYDEELRVYMDVTLERSVEKLWCDYFSGSCDESDFDGFDIDEEKEGVCEIYEEYYVVNLDDENESEDSIQKAPPAPLGMDEIYWYGTFDFTNFCADEKGMIEFAIYSAEEDNGGQQKICETIYNSLELGENELELECEKYKGRGLDDLKEDEKIIFKVRGTSNEKSNIIKIGDSRIEVIPA